VFGKLAGNFCYDCRQSSCPQNSLAKWRSLKPRQGRGPALRGIGRLMARPRRALESGPRSNHPPCRPVPIRNVRLIVAGRAVFHICTDRSSSDLARTWEAQSTNARCARPVNTGWPCCASLPDGGASRTVLLSVPPAGEPKRSLSVDPFNTNAVGWLASEPRPPH